MKVLKDHVFTRKSVGARKHDWDTLLDGQTRQLGADDMGEAKPSTFASQARTQATKRGLSMHIQTTDDGEGLIIQAVPADNGEANTGKGKGKKAKAS